MANFDRSSDGEYPAADSGVVWHEDSVRGVPAAPATGFRNMRRATRCWCTSRWHRRTPQVTRTRDLSVAL